MKNLTLREIQLEELDILLKVTKFFDDNSINYILCGGTMLGAVRHNGFIPWDDDIDLLVPRDDYERLRELVNQNKANLDGVCFKIPGSEKYIYPYIKAVNPSVIVDYGKKDDKNLWIDIFTMDHFPDNKLLHWIYLQRIITLVRALSISTYSRENLKLRGYYDSMTRRIKLLVAKFLYVMFGGYRRISHRIDKIACTMDRKYKSSNHVGDGTWPMGMNDYFDAKAMSITTKHKFEGHEFNIPVNYDAYLSKLYGPDYMTPPPPEKRQTHYITAYRI